MRVLLADERIDPNIARETGRTALMVAAALDYPNSAKNNAIVRTLLNESRARANMRTADCSGLTALDYAFVCYTIT